MPRYSDSPRVVSCYTMNNFNKMYKDRNGKSLKLTVATVNNEFSKKYLCQKYIMPLYYNYINNNTNVLLHYNNLNNNSVR